MTNTEIKDYLKDIDLYDQYIPTAGFRMLNGFSKISDRTIRETLIIPCWELCMYFNYKINIESVKRFKYDLFFTLHRYLNFECDEKLIRTMVDFLWHKVIEQKWEKGNDFVECYPRLNLTDEFVYNNSDKDYELLFDKLQDDEITSKLKEISYNTLLNFALDHKRRLSKLMGYTEEELKNASFGELRKIVGLVKMTKLKWTKKESKAEMQDKAGRPRNKNVIEKRDKNTDELIETYNSRAECMEKNDMGKGTLSRLLSQNSKLRFYKGYKYVEVCNKNII